MIVAMVTVRVVKVAVYQAVNMIPVRNSSLAAIGAVLVTIFVTATRVFWRATNESNPHHLPAQTNSIT